MFKSKEKLYNIYIKNNSELDIEVIEDKINYNALFFAVFWLLYHRIWLQSVIIIAISLVLFSLNILSLNICFFIFIALNANHWKEQNIKQKGYKYIAAIISNSKENALKSYFHSHNQNFIL